MRKVHAAICSGLAKEGGFEIGPTFNNPVASICDLCITQIDQGFQACYVADTYEEQRNLGRPLMQRTKDGRKEFTDGIPPLPAPVMIAAPEVDYTKLAAECLPKITAFIEAHLPPRRVEIVVNDMPVQVAGVQHKAFPLLLTCLLAGVNVWLAGPSGSGKSTAAINAAKALGQKFRYTGAVGDAYSLMGYKDAQGRYVRTEFREAWEHGGLFLWDEVDASDPNAVLAFNAALANGLAAFPDTMVPRHPACLIVAAANTWGHGATHEYVGRGKMDAAFLKRFAFLEWPYDEDLERRTSTNAEWCKIVQTVRKNVKEKGIRVLITPRETEIGARLLAAGLSIETVQEMTIRSGMTQDQWDSVKPTKPAARVWPATRTL